MDILLFVMESPVLAQEIESQHQYQKIIKTKHKFSSGKKSWDDNLYPYTFKNKKNSDTFHGEVKIIKLSYINY